jgi:ubiquinol-cytochrome c reductase cytochrome b subunit
VWYFTPFYAILRSVPSKGWGAFLMLAAIVLLFVLPWLDRCKVKSIRYRGASFKVALAVFVVSFIALGYLGLQPATGLYVTLARIFTILYFAFFLLMPLYTANEKTRPVPERVVYHHD